MVNDMRRFAICEGTRRESKGSCLCFRQPQTMSKPCSSLSTIAGMSDGSFWRSPSSVTTIDPLP